MIKPITPAQAAKEYAKQQEYTLTNVETKLRNLKLKKVKLKIQHLKEIDQIDKQILKLLEGIK